MGKIQETLNTLKSIYDDRDLENTLKIGCSGQFDTEKIIEFRSSVLNSIKKLSKIKNSMKGENKWKL